MAPALNQSEVDRFLRDHPLLSPPRPGIVDISPRYISLTLYAPLSGISELALVK